MNVFDLFARLSLDTSEYERDLGGAEHKASSFGSKIGGALKTGAKVGVAAVGAASTAVVALTKQAIDSYAEYEQLVGGVETLFGDSSQTVLKNAQEAFRTAGISANEYMETVTSFSASLLQSLGGDTQKAADYADMALRDMSDNANKMGTSMESIQNAYQGFAKQNYTMLDNLKLGYGGTKSEMERLVADAEKLNSSFRAQRDENGNLTLSYADVVDAIHIVQTQMGITGTTALEASTTISGSIGAMKSAWANLLTGVADDNANFTQLVDNFIGTLVGEGGQGGVINNLIPRIQQTLQGVTRLVTTGAQTLLPIVVDTIVSNLPAVVQAGIQVIMAFVNSIIQNIPALIDAAMGIMSALVNGLIEALPQLIPAVIGIITTIIAKLLDPETISKLLTAAVKIVLAIGQGLVNALPQLLKSVTTLVNGIGTALKNFVNTAKTLGGNIISAVRDGINAKIGEITAKIQQLKESLSRIFKSLGDAALSWGRDLIGNFVSGLQEKLNTLKEKAIGIAQQIKNVIGFSEPKEGPLSNFHTYAPDMMELFAKGIRDNGHLITDAVSSGFDIRDQIGAGFNGGASRNSAGSSFGIQTPFVITNVVELDGAVLARKTYTHNQNEINRHGLSLVKA